MFIIRDYESLSRPEVAGKVIKAKDFWAFKDAERTLADALVQQQQIITSAEVAYEAEKKRGYAEGNEVARLEQSGNMVEIVSQTVEYFGKVETQMTELVLEAVRKVVSDFDNQQQVTTVVKSCLNVLRTQKHLSLSVHPSQVDYLRGQIGELQRLYPSIAHIEVHPDAKLSMDACVVESEIGVVEASLAGQVEMLREALSVVFDQPELVEDDESPLHDTRRHGQGNQQEPQE